MRRRILIALVLVSAAGLTAWAVHVAEQPAAAPIGANVAPLARPLQERAYWLEENQPLERPVRLVALRPPATAELADGSKFEVYGVRLIAPVDLSLMARLARVADENVEFEILDPGSPTSRADVKSGGVGICGNTRGPVPKYHRRDLAAMLVMNGVALPTATLLRDDPNDARKLFEGLQTGITTYNLHEPINLAGDAEAAQLGRRLLTDHPDLKLAGVWLLAKARDEQFVAAAAERVDALLAAGVTGGSYQAGQRQLELRVLRALLHELGHREELAALTRKEFDAYGMQSPYEQPVLALTLVSLGDWGPLDGLVARLSDPAVPDAYANPLAVHLADRLDFPLHHGEDRRSFVRWYDAVRGRLTWDSRWRFGFGPDTQKQYRASMQPYLPGAQQPAAK